MGYFVVLMIELKKFSGLKEEIKYNRGEL